MINVNLDPCRYCGGEAEIVECESDSDYTRMVIKCKRCGITLDHTQPYVLCSKRNRIGNHIYYKRRSEDMSAIEIWNGGMLDGKNS
jgi:RecJ-like exonuclease